MQENFDTAVETVLSHEGGYTRDQSDAGNWTGGSYGSGQLKGTKYGISAASYPELDIQNLSLSDAKAIYKSDYWDVVSGDSLPSGVDYFVFDTAVNQGVHDAVLFLQQAAGASPDGVMGPETRSAVRSVQSVKDLLSETAARRMYDYMQLSPDLIDRFGLGWSRRVMDAVIKAHGLT